MSLIFGIIWLTIIIGCTTIIAVTNLPAGLMFGIIGLCGFFALTYRTIK